jgi:hypothetical protein
MEEANKQIETVQIKLIALSHEKQGNLSIIKSYSDKNNKIFYKDIVLLDMSLISEIFPSKIEYKLRLENLLSLSSSTSKILDLNNSIKSVY